MKRLLTAEVLLLALLASTAAAYAVGVATADDTRAVAAVVVGSVADTRPCVTRGEHRQIKFGMPKAKVHRIFDFNGVRFDRIPRCRLYRWCNGDYYTAIIYHKRKPARVKSILVWERSA